MRNYHLGWRRWGAGLLATAVMGGAVGAEESGVSTEDIRADAMPLLTGLDLGETRQERLLGHLEGFLEQHGNEFAGSLVTEEALKELREILARHGFVEAELAWLAEPPQDGAAELRGAVVLLQAGQLLRHGPRRLDGHWPEWNKGETPGEGGPDKEDAGAAGEEAATAESAGLDAALQAFIPKNPIYKSLLEHYARMTESIEKLREEFIEIPKIEEGTLVRAGDRYEAAELLARRLAEEGHLEDPEAALGDTPGVYTEELAKAVEHFQDYHGRQSDGIIGPDTLEALTRSPDDQLKILRLNLHRARLLPDDFGPRYILVNVPSTSLAAFDGGGKPALTMKVIVGEANRQRETPVFRDVMETLEFAPFWNVPTSIASRDIVPRARRNHGYLASNNYEIVSDFGASQARGVSSSTLSGVESGSLFIRQRPGKNNALGSVKFLFPNDYAIYLHDTPKGELFEESERDFSNGCIRVEDPQALGTFVLGPQGWDSEKVAKALDASETQRVKVESEMNIYIIYFTAYPAWDDDEPVRFFPDLYEQDAKLMEKAAD